LNPGEIRNMTREEIEQTVSSLKEKLFGLRAELVSGRLERPQRIKLIRRDLARCYTILKEKTGEE